jgi:hypothetical protein
MTTINQRLATLVQSKSSIFPVNRLAGSVVKRAVCKMKPRKMDVSEVFFSDALLHAPDSLFDKLAMVYRSWLVHGTLTLSLLACAFMPLSRTTWLLLKLFDQCVIVVWG